MLKSFINSFKSSGKIIFCGPLVTITQSGGAIFKIVGFSFFLIAICSANLVSARTATDVHQNLSSVEKEQPNMTVKGKVTDMAGDAISGVAVSVKGTTTGTITNYYGQYSLDIPVVGKILVFSFDGMITQEEVLDARTDINVKLARKRVDNDETIATELGIQRDKKTLACSIQQVSGEEIMKSKDINFMNSLSGKIAGLEIKKSSSGVGGSTRVVLKGVKSLSQISEPLFVIDGIPMVNRKGSQPDMWGGIDDGDGLSQVNADDIESISVLKSSNATVLYGSQGANGVVMITTKKGQDGKTSICFSSSTIMERVIKTPELQFSYGSDGGSNESWSYTKGNYASNYVNDFFQTGSTLINTVSVSGGNNKTTAYFSYGNTSAAGVIQNNKYQKNNVTFQQSTKLLDDKLTIRSNVMLTTEKAENRNAAGYYLNPLTGLYLFPRDKNFDLYKDNYQVFNKDRNMYLQNWFSNDQFQSNPYWIINKQPKEDLTKRVIASVTVDYDITKCLSFQARLSYDFAEKSYEQKFFAGSNPINVSGNGRWSYKKYNDEQTFSDGMFTYQNKFNNVSVTGILGANYQQSNFGKGVSVDSKTIALRYPNEFYFQNLPSNVLIQSTALGKLTRMGLFGNAQIGYKELIFLDLSGRNDWTNALSGQGNDSYFYPSAGMSLIVSRMIDFPWFVSFSKIRISNSRINNDVTYNTIAQLRAINGTDGVSQSAQNLFVDPKPEKLNTWEFGSTWEFFNGILGFDLTYYKVVTSDVLVSRVSPGSGYAAIYENTGKIRNSGLEFILTAKPVKSSDFDWETNVNFSKNTNRVIELFPGNPYVSKDFGASEGYCPVTYSGGSIGDLYGYKFLRNANGQIILDDITGALRKTANVEYMGNLEPDFSLGWNNRFSYKRFSLNFLINAKMGGKCFSQTEAMLDGYGVSKRSADARDNGGVQINAIKETTSVNKIDAKLYYTTVGNRNGIAEAYAYDRTNIRLSQLALSYDFSMKKLNLPIKAASFAIVGQNLFFLYKKAPFDPELTMSTDLNNQSLDNFNLPATRTFGFTIKISL